MQRSRFPLVLVAILALEGFAVSAAAKDKPKPSIDGAPIARSIVLCKTTLAELRAQLGEPTRVGILHKDHLVSWITEYDPLPRYLAVLLNDHDVVTDMYWDVPTEIPWVPTNQCGGT